MYAHIYICIEGHHCEIRARIVFVVRRVTQAFLIWALIRHHHHPDLSARNFGHLYVNRIRCCCVRTIRGTGDGGGNRGDSDRHIIFGFIVKIYFVTVYLLNPTHSNECFRKSGNKTFASYLETLKKPKFGQT